MQDITAKWAQEIDQHASARETIREERAEWDKERSQWKAERRKRESLPEEQMKLELERKCRELEKEKAEEERKKAGSRWQDPQPDEDCLRPGTRRYTAKLENVPAGYNRMKACQETQAWVNGRWVTPTQCDDGGPFDGVLGTWIVDWDEGDCYSSYFLEKGCYGDPL
ncbi:hypothetical protein EST38_g12231 [Candolleomyces aberdarensis]|uniref:Uncharacterized protein n=1 Tax=Candolleomyces aberdarensis TaxID=2316362 RepID=A0A4Q2D568_9AGAR|nr:hypothetical protein EST38_g12231 [Candolleomyces aberdarensis]